MEVIRHITLPAPKRSSEWEVQETCFEKEKSFYFKFQECSVPNQHSVVLLPDLVASGTRLKLQPSVPQALPTPLEHQPLQPLVNQQLQREVFLEQQMPNLNKQVRQVPIIFTDFFCVILFTWWNKNVVLEFQEACSVLLSPPLPLDSVPQVLDNKHKPQPLEVPVLHLNRLEEDSVHRRLEEPLE